MRAKKYRFWSVYGQPGDPQMMWYCIPPSKKYIPDWYPKNALVKKHRELWLPPPNYWLEPRYETIVYFNDY